MRVCILEFSKTSHSELFASWVFLLNQLDIVPHIYTNTLPRKGTEEWLQSLNLKYQYTNHIVDNDILQNEYDFIMLNTLHHTHSPYFSLPDTKTICVSHDPEKVGTNVPLQTRIITVSPHAKKFFENVGCQNVKVVLPCYFRSQLSLNRPLQSKQDESIVFIVQGNIEFKKRDYLALVPIAEKFAGRNFVIKIVGAHKNSLVTKRDFGDVLYAVGHSEKGKHHFQFCLDYKWKEYLDIVNEATFLMTLTNLRGLSYHKEHNKYEQFRLTSTVTVGLGHQIPLLIDNVLADIYNFDDSNCICYDYESESGLEHAFERALSLTKEEYSQLQKKVVQKYQQIQEENQLALENLLLC